MSSPIDISIIIPVYNCEKYLHDCIVSILGQRSVAIELIFVNDGSTDRSEHIIREHADKHPNIHLISQPNKGAAAARNRGIELARGRYTLFVDADDSIVDDSLAGIVAEADRHQADILQLTHYIDQVGEDRKERRIHPVRTCIDGVSYFRLMQRKRCLITGTFNQLLRTEFIQNLPFRFDESLIRCQDLEYFTKAMIKAGRVMNYPTPYYVYNIGTPTGGDSARRNHALLFDCYRTIVDNFAEFARSEELGAEMAKRLDYLVCSHIYGYPADVFRRLPAESCRFWVKFIRKHIFYNNGWLRPQLHIKLLRLNSILWGSSDR